MTQDEIRQELGLKPLNDEELTAEDEDRYSLKKVGTIVSDGKELPLFDSIEEAEAEAERLGCSGHHIHTQDGKEYFMPCENHDQLIDLKDCDCGDKKKECDKKCYEDVDMITPNPSQSGYEPIGHKIKDGRKVPNCVPIKAKTELDAFLETVEDIPEGWELIGD